MSKLQLKTKNYTPIIGLEVHVELSTESKMFCGCSAKHFLEKPNTHTCPVCLGLPGALPVPNQKAIDWCMMIGLALGCQINDISKFDRKNYFYPDLPKGYQISQYDQPFCSKGLVKLQATSYKLQAVRINRVHMEEDTAKLQHSKNETLIDFNRSGVPLVEIVTEPDMNSSEEAVTYLKKIQQIVRYLGVSDCDMEKGSMRLEANISLQKLKSQNSNLKITVQNLKLPNYKVEVKNINSFRFVGRAIDYEIERQKELLEKGETPKQETRGFDVKSGKTYSQRSKEEAHDYRYFPEPDIPPFTKLKAQSSKLKAELPELPDKKVSRFIRQYQVSEYNAEQLCVSRATADYFEESIKTLKHKNIKTQEQKINSSRIANLIINKKIDIKKHLPAEFIKILLKKTSGKISDTDHLSSIIQQVIKNYPEPVADYKKGKTNAIMFLVGRVMNETKGKADALLVKKLLIKELG